MSSLGIERLGQVMQIEGADAAGAITHSSESNGARYLGKGNATPAGEAPAQSFGEMLSQSFEQVNQHQHQADRAIKELVAGRNKNVHETMLAVERADASLRLMMQVRNKILEAYREVMRMQV